MAVSPFDGANRIRFKGSLDFRFLIADLRLVDPEGQAQWAYNTKSKITNRKSKIVKVTRLSAASVQLPRKLCVQP
jgi:hypothetical protein